MQLMAEEPRDEELMLRVRHGDGEAFRALYERHKGPLLRFCFQMLRNWEDAGDVLQDAFRWVAAHAAAYEPRARFTTYLYRIARNRCIDILRSRRRWNLKPLPTGFDAADDTAGAPRFEPGEIESHIRKALDDVPELYREVLQLRIVEAMSYDDIAEVLDCPVGTVKSRLHTALGLLRQALRRRKIVE